MDFADYLSVIFLDTDHSDPIDGEQRDWLATVLNEREHVSHVFPIYHVGAFPSVRNAEGATHRRIREHRLP